MSSVEPRRPSPIVTDDNHEFWEAVLEGRLVAQRCQVCGHLRHPPRPMCPECHSLRHALVELSGFGEIYSYSILHYPQFSAFDYPVIAVLVDLDEGIRVASNLVAGDPNGIRIGLPVEVQFEPTAENAAVPVFARRKTS
jgi:uncharacterized OB-fold protein